MTKKNIPNISITDVQRDQSHNHNINVPNFSLMSSIPKTQFQIPTFSNKNYNKYQKEKNKNIHLYMSSETNTNKNNTSNLDNKSYPNKKEATSNTSTPCKIKMIITKTNFGINLT